MKSSNAKLGDKDAYNYGNGVVPDALIILHDAHPLQRHKSAVRVAVQHFGAHVLDPKFRVRVVKFIGFRKLSRPVRTAQSTLNTEINLRSYLDLGSRSGAGGLVHHRLYPLSHLAIRRTGIKNWKGAGEGKPAWKTAEIQGAGRWDGVTRSMEAGSSGCCLIASRSRSSALSCSSAMASSPLAALLRRRRWPVTETETETGCSRGRLLSSDSRCWGTPASLKQSAGPRWNDDDAFILMWQPTWRFTGSHGIPWYGRMGRSLGPDGVR